MRFLLVLAAMALGFTAPVAAQTLDGWDQVRTAIEQTAPANMASLNGRRFEVRLQNTNASGLVLTPAEAFSVTASGSGTFVVEIVNASALVRRIGTVFQKLPVTWVATYVRTGGDKFPITIEGVDQCVFSLTFRQRGGALLDLTDTARDFNVSWAISNPSVIATSEVSGRSLVLTRQEGNNNDVSVTLRLLSNDGTIDIASEPISIPKCGRFVSNSYENRAILQLRTPGQCVVPTANLNTDITSRVGGIMVQRFEETFANSCDRPVRCNFRWDLTGYPSLDDAVAERNGTFLAEATNNNVLIQPNSYVRLDERVQAPRRYGYYRYGHLQTPDGALSDLRNSNVVCRWAD